VSRKSFLPGAAELVQRLREVGVAGDEAREVVGDDVVDGAVAVGLVDALADVFKELRVLHVQAVAVEEVHGAGVEGRLGEGVEGVDVVVPRRRHAHLAGVVELVALLAGELAHAVPRAAYVLVPVHLEDVPVALVDEQATDG
jgi:hypothetical protein